MPDEPFSLAMPSSPPLVPADRYADPGGPGPLILAYGGGKDSTALLIGWRDRDIRPDLILFAEVGGRLAREDPERRAEKPETYRFLEQHIRPWLERYGFPELVTVYNEGMHGSLEANCLSNEMLPSSAYGMHSCADKYKVVPQNNYVKAWEPALTAWEAGHQVRKAIGYHAGERRRAKVFEDDKYRYVYPLIEWGWDKPECERRLLAEFGEIPPKSACFFCGYSKKQEVRWLAQHHPDLFARAVEIERNAAPNQREARGLGYAWSWETLAAAAEAALPLFLERPPMQCVCFDGDD
jgi:hypothetical protein